MNKIMHTEERWVVMNKAGKYYGDACLDKKHIKDAKLFTNERGARMTATYFKAKVVKVYLSISN